MPTNDPKPTPITRTLPPTDVVFDDSPPESRSLRVSSADLAVLRRIAMAAPDSSPPRPSLPVRAARGAKHQSPWIGLGVLLAELVRYVLSTL